MHPVNGFFSLGMCAYLLAQQPLIHTARTAHACPCTADAMRVLWTVLLLGACAAVVLGEDPHSPESVSQTEHTQHAEHKNHESAEEKIEDSILPYWASQLLAQGRQVCARLVEHAHTNGSIHAMRRHTPSRTHSSPHLPSSLSPSLATRLSSLLPSWPCGTDPLARNWSSLVSKVVLRPFALPALVLLSNHLASYSHTSVATAARQCFLAPLLR